jgi:hypothetical protein
LAKVLITIEGDDAADAVNQLRTLAANLLGGAAPAALATPNEPAPPAKGRGKKAEAPAPADLAQGPSGAAASPAAAETSSGSPAATGAASSTTSAAIDLENGDEGGAGADGVSDEPTYEQLKAAMTAAIERAPNQDPLVVQTALFNATGAKALKHLTTTGAAGGPIIAGKGNAALAALEAVGRS